MFCRPAPQRIPRNLRGGRLTGARCGKAPAEHVIDSLAIRQYTFGYLFAEERAHLIDKALCDWVGGGASCHRVRDAAVQCGY